MNQKEFELLANILLDPEYKWRSVTSGVMARKVGNRLALVMAAELEKNYPKFDRNKFLTACGLGE